VFKQYTYKQKFIAVILGFLMLCIAAYKKTYKHIFQAKNELNHIEQKLSTTISYEQLFALKNELNSIDNIIGGNATNINLVQQHFLDFITSSKLNVDIVGIEDVHVSQEEGFDIYTNQVELKGDYADLVSLFYEIEKDFKHSRAANARLFSKKNYRTNKKILLLKIIFQNYEKT